MLICENLLGMKMLPKEFITGFLTKKHTLLRYQCCTWATKCGWTFTQDFLQIIAKAFRRTRAGSARWARFIEAEGNQHQKGTTCQDLSKAHELLLVNSLLKVPSTRETSD
ncbi:hypothetical protein PSTT_07196 [Puccinia striiformis]|uniref:Uncharacterized protein n=1 Tax=Puccinia striiformis TaxID=27350 RepID=A0A2S4VH62_9BASI|nr:hypothetical protein PSTT_07196 [Puccinia striiformis]